jgi:hypothetical protein
MFASLVLLPLLGLVATSLAVPSQGRPADAIDRALLAAPARRRDQATVIEWNRDFTYRTLKKGRSRLTPPGLQP